MARKAVGKLLIAVVLAGLGLLGPGVADAGVAVKTGLYQGQTTNFRTPGGGFAPVYEGPL